MLRRVFFWLHLVAGVGAGAVILVMSVTGLLLTYEKQILAWADRGSNEPSVPADTERFPSGVPRLPVKTLASNARAAGGGSAPPTSMVFYAGGPIVAAAIGGNGASGRGGNTIYLDAYSGESLGSGSTRA